MSLSIILGEVPYSLASAHGWKLVADWAETLPDKDYALIQELCNVGAVDDTEELSSQIRDALHRYKPEEDVEHTLTLLLRSISGGARDEKATVVS